MCCEDQVFGIMWECLLQVEVEGWNPFFYSSFPFPSFHGSFSPGLYSSLTLLSVQFSHRDPSSLCRHKRRHRPGGRCIGRQDQVETLLPSRLLSFLPFFVLPGNMMHRSLLWHSSYQYTCGKQMSGEVRGKCCSRSPDTCGSSSSSGGGGREGRRRRA